MQLRRLAIMMVSVALLGACGDDDSSATDAGMDAGASTAGNTAPKTDSAVPPAEIMCKSTKCVAPELDATALFGDAGSAFASFLTPETLASFGAAPEACCFGEAGDKCGVSSSMLTMGECVEANQEGKPDDTCPALTNTIMNPALPIAIPINLPGCCRPDNKCGLDTSLLGTGCVERTAASAFAMTAAANSMIDAGNIDAGAPLEEIKCVYNPVAADDGGTEDAGN